MSLFISSKDKTPIEILVDYNGPKLDQAPGIIIAHPYGPLGGSMNNNVVMALKDYFLNQGYITICLNFRGCGHSKGKTSWTGMPERDDYLSVIDAILDDQIQKELPKVNRLILCGYSFGAMIANSIECTRVPCSYLLISLCLGVTWALAITKSSFFKKHAPDQYKVLCIYGSRDQFTGSHRYESWCEKYSNTTCIKVPDADHFWFGYEQVLIDHVHSWHSKLDIQN
ncbi:hypothetical protein RMATCC62417_07571 [Rhizopus microsporus]|nr:hypothetical protein RMATCC62417_07571 [Rhizopus microsporus]